MELQKYAMNEGTIEIPTEWKDQTINIISATNGKGFSLSISRDEMPWGMSFEEFALGEYEKLSEAFNEFEEDGRQVIEIEGKRCPVFRFHWSSPQGKLSQMLIMIQKTSHVLIMTASSSSAISENQREQILNIFESFKHRSMDEST